MKAVKDGRLHPDKLKDAESSEKRRELLASVVGKDNAESINTLFERQLLLKNQQKAMISFIKEAGGLKPEIDRSMIARVEKMTEVLNPKSQTAFLEDLVAHKLGLTVDMDTAANISELARMAKEKRIAMEAGERRAQDSDKATPTELEYGRAAVAFDNYLTDLKKAAQKETFAEMLSSAGKDPVNAARRFVTGIAGTAKAIGSSMDNSFIGRQGIQLFFKGITGDKASWLAWKDTFFKSFKIIWDTFGGKPVMDELKAIMVSDPDYKIMKKMGVAIGTIEEMYPVSWPGKIPLGVGKAFEASENAYNGSAYYMRYRVAKSYLEVARNSGIDLADSFELQSIGKLVNSLTMRGDTGSKRQQPGFINNVFWSPKMMKASIDILTAHQFDTNMSKFARKQAAINLLRIVGGTAIVLGIAKVIDPDSVELDSRSSDFGKIKVGNTRFTVNPLAGYVVLASRIITRSSKSSVTGEVADLSLKGFGKQTVFDALVNFMSNKTSPAATQVVSYLKNESRRDRKKPFSATEAAVNLTTPLPIQNVFELAHDPESANLLLGMIADGLGISTQTYSEFSNTTDADLKTALGKALKKDGTPHKGEEAKVKRMKEELQRRSQE